VDKAQKERVVAELAERLRTTDTLIVADYRGLTMPQIDDLRTKLLEQGARFQVVKNTLTKRAAEVAGADQLLALLDGPTAIAFSQDPVAAAKAAVEYANRNTKLTIVGGGLSGQPLDPAGIRALAVLPSLDELRSKIIGLLNAPATKLAVLLQTPGGQLARVLAAHAEAGGAAQGAAEVAETVAEADGAAESVVETGEVAESVAEAGGAAEGAAV